MGSAAKTVLIFVAVAAVGLFAWAYWKSKQPGAASGGWMGTVKGLWGGASGATQAVTDASVRLGSTAGSAIKSGAAGAGDIVTGALHVGGNANPLNWF
jgi:hypothetical protein